jgi:iron(III) transport system substrate-binding protein
MNRAKRYLALFMVMLLVLVSSACQKIEETPSSETTPASQGSENSEASSSGEALTPEEQWAQDNGLYLDESMEELYQKALEEEGGEVVVYTISSRLEKIKPMFEEDYPGMTLTPYDISSGELMEKFTREYEAGIKAADIIHSKEQVGQYLIEYFQTGILHNYQPESIFANTDPSYMYLTPLLFELNLWFYNTEVYDECPITSWWDLTKPEWKGRFVFQDAVDNTAYLAMLTTMVQHADDMAEDYKRVFGEDIVLADDEPTAAHAFIKRFLANDPIMAEGSDEVIEMVGAPGQTNPPVGYSSSVKLRQRDEKGYAIDYSPLTMTPTNGIYAMNFLGIVNECEHPNGAKLFIKYILGGEDGQGRGYSPFATLGTWPARPENPNAEGNVPLEDIPLWPTDFDYVYNNILDVRDYWIAHR